MALYLGLDTSNYASSAALYDTQTDKVYMNRKLLPVQEGSLGLRQSEAVFLHVKQFSDVINELLRQADCAGQPLSGIGVFFQEGQKVLICLVFWLEKWWQKLWRVSINCLVIPFLIRKDILPLRCTLLAA